MASPKKSSPMIEAHLKALAATGKKTVESGWFESDRYPAAKGKSVGEQVARIARIQENGAIIKKKDGGEIQIEARPFMRRAWSTFNKDRKAIQDRVAKRIVRGDITADQGLEQMGQALEGHIVKSIKNGGWKSNSAATIKAKGFDKPLIDTAHMWKSVNSKVS